MVEVSQSMGRQSKMVDTMPCLTPKMQRWVTSRCRLVHGVESMMFQGLAYKSCSNLGEKFSSDLLCDIAHLPEEPLVISKQFLNGKRLRCPAPTLQRAMVTSRWT